MIDMLQEMSNFIFKDRYAKYIDHLKRRETFQESVNRSLDMHLYKFKKLPKEDLKEIIWAFGLVGDRRVASSMRSLQFAGPAIKQHHEKMYNCVVRHVDSIRAFSELFFLALNGCGTTFGVSKFFINRLPDLVDASNKTGTVLLYQIEDTIEGWADSVEALMCCYFRNTAFTGRKIVFDYSKIRKRGAKLKTTGGKAPGYEGLKAAHIKIKKLLDYVIEVNKQTRLKTIDAADILCHCMDAVLSGGIRRSAAALIFDLDDEDLLRYKTGDWMKNNPQRARVNISALVLRDKVTFEQFYSVFKHVKEFGDPGFVFANHPWQLFNPCFEISFIPVTSDGVCGAQFCNLTTINGSKVKTLEEWKECVKAATIIGTLQAAYTEFPYLSKTAKQLTEEEALLGVSITGFMDNPTLLLNPEYQKEMANYAVEVNKEWAKKIGVRQAARITCVKPEGTSSLFFKSGSGIHAHHDYEYLRLIQCNKLDPVYQYFKTINPHMCFESLWSANKTDDVIVFPVTVDKSCMVLKDLNAIKHLEIIRSTQQNWVNNGTTLANQKDIKHNVSCTIVIQENEWDEVANYLFKYRNDFSAVALLAHTGDKDFPQAPRQKIETEEDRKSFNHYLNNYIQVDYEKLIEEDDQTVLMYESACGGGKCER